VLNMLRSPCGAGAMAEFAAISPFIVILFSDNFKRLHLVCVEV